MDSLSTSDAEAAIEDLPSSKVPKWILSGATARTFAGKRTRRYSHDVLFRSFPAKPISAARQTRSKVVDGKEEPWCEKWGVMTTIFDASEAVQRQVHI